MYSENIKTSNSMGYLLLNVTNKKINEEVEKALASNLGICYNENIEKTHIKQ